VLHPHLLSRDRVARCRGQYQGPQGTTWDGVDDLIAAQDAPSHFYSGNLFFAPRRNLRLTSR